MANLFPGAAQIGYNPAAGPGYSQTPDQTQGLGLAKMAAMGQAPSAAEVQQRAGIDQAQRAAASTAASTRGAFGLAGAQRSAAGQQAGLAQQAVNSSAQLRAQEQATARGQYMDASAQARAQALQANGMSLEAATSQAQMEQQQNQANQAMMGQFVGGAASATGSILSPASRSTVIVSDARAKHEYADFGLEPSPVADIPDAGGGPPPAASGPPSGGGGPAPGLGAAFTAFADGFNGKAAQAKASGPAPAAAAPPIRSATSDSQIAPASAPAPDPYTQQFFGSLPGGSYSDMPVGESHLREPGGGAAWMLREEPSFILAMNERTGKMGAINLKPLTADQKRQAKAPHGAGPLPSVHGDEEIGDTRIGNVASYEHPDGTWTAQPTDDEKPGLGALSSKVRAMAGPEGNTERGFDGWLRDQQRKQLAEAGVPHAQEIQPVGYVPTREQAMMSREQSATSHTAPENHGLRSLGYGEDLPGEDLVDSMKAHGMIGPERRARMAGENRSRLAAMAAVDRDPEAAFPAVRGGIDFRVPEGMPANTRFVDRGTFVNHGQPTAHTPVDTAPTPDRAWLAQMAGRGFRPSDDSLVSDMRAKMQVATAAHSAGFQAGVKAAAAPGIREPVVASRGEFAHGGAAAMAPDGGRDVQLAWPEVRPGQDYVESPFDPATGQPLKHGSATGAQVEGLRQDFGYEPPDTLTSDERAKTMEDQHPGTAAARQFLDTLEPHTFGWKDPRLAPNPNAAVSPNLGVFAQQVEQSPYGKAIVQNDPQTGLKTLDNKAMLGAMAAGAGALKAVQDDHAKRLEAVEQAIQRGVDMTPSVRQSPAEGIESHPEWIAGYGYRAADPEAARAEREADLYLRQRQVTPSWKSKYEAATKVLTSPEIQQGGGKGGIGAAPSGAVNTETGTQRSAAPVVMISHDAPRLAEGRYTPVQRGIREPVEFERIREAPTVDPEADNASVVQYSEHFRPPPPTLTERAGTGLAQLAMMRRKALGDLGPGKALVAAREPTADSGRVARR